MVGVSKGEGGFIEGRKDLWWVGKCLHYYLSFQYLLEMAITHLGLAFPDVIPW